MDIPLLKNDVTHLMEALAEDSSNKVQAMLVQCDAMLEDLEYRREECIQLQNVLADMNLDMRPPSFTGHMEHGGLLTLRTTLIAKQQTLIRRLEAEIQAEKSNAEKSRKEMTHELRKLHEDNEKLNFLKQDFGEKLNMLQDQIKKLSKQFETVSDKVNTGVMPVTDLKMERRRAIHVANHAEMEYMGMFEYKKGDEAIIIKNLIYDLKPTTASNLLPGLPAYMLFMCIRHTDYINDDEKVKCLLDNTIDGIKQVIKKQCKELDYTILWLSNTCRLLHNLEQYSGKKEFQVENTMMQNQQCLRNFDLSEYRQILSDVANWIYKVVIKLMENRIQPFIVPAVLEHESIPGISSMRGRSSSSVGQQVQSPMDPQKALDALLKSMNAFFNLLSVHGVNPEVITQIYKQIFYFICAIALNNLLLRKDTMCHWSTGMQMRYNLENLQQWCRDLRLQHIEITQTLQPIIQASHLLQARRSDEDVPRVSDMCDKLTSSQIIKILNLYTPGDYEDRIPISFIRKMQSCLRKRDEESLAAGQSLAAASRTADLMDPKYVFPIRFPFNSSNIRLEDVVIPECLDLHHVLRKV